jgi:hypothetical protein
MEAECTEVMKLVYKTLCSHLTQHSDQHKSVPDRGTSRAHVGEAYMEAECTEVTKLVYSKNTSQSPDSTLWSRKEVTTVQRHLPVT